MRVNQILLIADGDAELCDVYRRFPQTEIRQSSYGCPRLFQANANLTGRLPSHAMGTGCLSRAASRSTGL